MQKVLYRRNYTVPQRFAHPRPWLILPGCQLAYMPDVSGGRCYDFSGRGRHGTFNLVTFEARGRFGSCMKFLGPGNETHISTSGFHTPRVSVSVWLNTRVLSTSNLRGIVGDFDGTDTMFHVYWEGGGPDIIFRVDTAGGSDTISHTAITKTHVWYHLVFMYDTTYMYFYVNGNLKKSKQHAYGGDIVNTGNDLYVGAVGSQYSSSTWDGWIDEIQIYNRALTEDEIQLLYANGKVRY